MICEIDGWVQGGMQPWGAGACAALGMLVTVRAQLCEIDGVLRGMQSEVLVKVLFWVAACGVF